MKEKIDFVILWVDGNDPKWQAEKAKYDTRKKNDGVNSQIRYRDWDNLKYWFRGVEKYAPWVNNIYFVTWGHLPKWLNTKNKKLKIVKHEDFIDKKYLPLFSSNAIEYNIHKIKGLSETFVLFNDDMFLISDTKKEDFFKNGKPCDNYNEVNLDMNELDKTFAATLNNNYQVLGQFYNKRRTILSRPFKYINYKYGLKKNLQTIKTTLTYKSFKGINNEHVAQPFLKSYFYKVWELVPKLADGTSSHKFRNKSDITQYLIRYFQLMDGNFYPRTPKIGKYFGVSNNNEEIIDSIINQKYKMICINDSDSNVDFEKSKKEINDAFDNILNEKSSFEK